MPLVPGASQKTVSKNISELHGGNTYARTKKKFGKKKADRQAVAIALNTARKHPAKRSKRRAARY